jgi:hypothetical protein
MKIIYQKTIAEKIRDAVHEAKRDGKCIEKIVLTKSEFDELKREYKLYALRSDDSYYQYGVMYYGVLIQCEAAE